MAVYVVVIPEDGEALPAAEILKAFPKHIEVTDRVWVIHSSLESCSRVAAELKLGEPSENRVAVVFTVSDSDGYYLKSFWDRLREMERSS